MSNVKIEISNSVVEQQELWNSSAYATIFSHPSVLPVLVNNLIWIKACVKEKIICIWPICISGFRNGGVGRFIYYVGPLWDNHLQQMKPHTRMVLKKEVYQAYIKYFVSEEIFPEFSLAVGDYNFRELMWACQELNLLIQASPKYTAFLNLSSNFSYRFLNESRKSDLRKFNRFSNQFIKSNECNSGEIFELYKCIFNKDQELNEEIELCKIEALCSLVDSGYGYLVCYRNIESELVSVALILSDRRTANLVLNLVSKKFLETGIGTKLIIDSIDHAISIGLLDFDFNGANSPSRAYFKHSFGAVEQLYFDVVIANRIANN